MTNGFVRFNRTVTWASALILGISAGVAAAQIVPTANLPLAWRVWLGFALPFALAGAVAGYRLALHSEGRWWRVVSAWLGWALVIAAAFAASRPLCSPHHVGAGDSYWYSAMLGDFVTQLRAGVFPIWVGQSEYAFNGSVFPLRIAPGLQHAAGVLDLLTGMNLSPLQMRNLLMTGICGAFGIAASGAFASALGGTRRPLASLFAATALLSSGFLAPLYSGDQYMQTLALVFVPCVVACWMRWADEPTPRVGWALGATLGAMVWAHTPLAAWTGAFSALVCGAIALTRLSPRTDWPLVWRAGLAALALGLFPVLSIWVIDNRIHPATAVHDILREVGNYLPLSWRPFRPEDLNWGAYQIGFGPAALLAVALVLTPLRRSRATLLPLFALAVILALIFPVGALTTWLWKHVPTTLVSLTNMWPHQRGIPLAMVIIVMVFARSCRGLGGWATAGLTAVALASFGWTAWQAWVVTSHVVRLRSPGETVERILRPETTMLTRYSYASFVGVPSYYTHGYTDPRLEVRLLKPGTAEVLSSNYEAAAPHIEGAPPPELIERGAFAPLATTSRTAFEMRPIVTLPKRGRYALRFEAPEGMTGVLVLNTSGMNRDFILPDAGSGMVRPFPPSSFGNLPTSSRVIPINTLADNEKLTVSLFLNEPHESPSIPFAIHRVDPARLPIVVESLVPFKAKVTASFASWLETPRIWYTGWTAIVNGKPVAAVRSPQGLVAVPLSPGESQVTVTYRPPAWLSALYWLSALIALAFIATGIRRLLSAPQPHPAAARS
ncbi:hypothetical protein [Nibricoccus sp. IMCC34717]|uniref:hypothetical protein n=1 Tax=Nibricoccus sp. IMCC34717 TaxID=3034021 RepID=UPI00384FC986